MKEYLLEQAEAQIKELWLRRNSLTEAEHSLFYRLVSGHLGRLHFRYYYALRRCHRFTSLDELKLQLIDDFYCDVIYLRALRGRESMPLQHLGALTRFYKNWLIDRIRRCMALLRHEELGSLDENTAASGMMGDSLAGWEESGDVEGVYQGIMDFIEDSSAEFAEEAVPDERVFRQDASQNRGEHWSKETEWDKDSQLAEEIDLLGDWRMERSSVTDTPSPGRIRLAANEFLDWAEHQQGKACEAPWILIFLGCHHCPDDAEDSIPMSTLKDRFAIPNYHERARRLGITSARGGFPSLEHFAKTLLGQWIRDLGFRIHLSELSAIGDALKILCEEALVRVKTKHLC